MTDTIIDRSPADPASPTVKARDKTGAMPALRKPSTRKRRTSVPASAERARPPIPPRKNDSAPTRRVIFMGANPNLGVDDHRDAQTLFERTGGNTGNLAFLNAVRLHVAGDVTVLPLGAPRREVRAAGDIIVLPLANQLGDHTDLGDWATWLADYDLPVIGLGLGAQARRQGDRISLSQGTLRWMETMRSLRPGAGPSIGLRGTFTEQQLAEAGFEGLGAVTGCPSNLTATTNPATRLAKRYGRQPKRIAVNAGIPYLPALARVERLLASLLSGRKDYIVQHGIEMIRIAYGAFADLEDGEFEMIRRYVTPDLDGDAFMAWCGEHAVALHGVDAWMDHVRGFDFVVGTRFHGAMLAMQAGIPAGCITHDSRTEEMCQTMGVPYCNYREVAGLTRNDLVQRFVFDAADYTARRAGLTRRYARIYADAGIEISRHLKVLLPVDG